MTRRRRPTTRKPAFPPCPVSATSAGWLLSVDPAAAKTQWAVQWVQRHRSTGAVPGSWREVDSADRGRGACDLMDVVLVEGGIKSADRARFNALLDLQHARGRWHGWADEKDAEYIEATPDQWRGVLGLPKRNPAGNPRHVFQAMAKRCRDMAASPSLPAEVRRFAAEATNDDKRAAFLLGWAAVTAWRWASATSARRGG